MAKSNNQKAKILYLERMLCETGENRTVTMQEILENLQENGIRAERKSIYDDLEVLRSFGMNIQFRRERPSGYYVAGQMAAEPAQETAQEETAMSAIPAEESDVPETEYITEEVLLEEETPAAFQEQPADAGRQPDQESWKKANVQAGSKKPMKLLCSKASLEDVKLYFGDTAEYKEKENGDIVVTAGLLEGKSFYGWLTAMGREVRLAKPKKAAAAYRDYLKMLAKEYKAD
jgi:hypothetical protein